MFVWRTVVQQHFASFFINLLNLNVLNDRQYTRKILPQRSSNFSQLTLRSLHFYRICQVNPRRKQLEQIRIKSKTRHTVCKGRKCRCVDTTKHQQLCVTWKKKSTKQSKIPKDVFKCIIPLSANRFTRQCIVCVDTQNENIES